MAKKKREKEVKFSKKLQRIIKLSNQLNGGIKSYDLTEAQIDEITELPSKTGLP